MARLLTAALLAASLVSWAKAAPAQTLTPSSPSDVFVQGKYDKNGVYVPPHYAPKQKPEFHGYFSRSSVVKHGHFYARPSSGAKPD